MTPDVGEAELRYYEKVAPRYHRLQSQPVQRYQTAVEAGIIGRLVGDGDRVAVVGCGGGREFGFLAPHAVDVVGLDFSRGMLDEARNEIDRLRALPGFAARSVELVQGDAANLPLDDGGADLVLCLAALNYMPEYERALAELARVTRPGGLIVLTVINRLELAGRVKSAPRRARQRLRREPERASTAYRRLFSARELRDLVAGAGLNVDQLMGVRLLVDLVPDRWNRDERWAPRLDRLLRLAAPVERVLTRAPFLRNRARFLLVVARRPV